MENGYSIVIDHDLKIIRYKHTGLIGFDDIGEAWTEFLGMKEFTEMGYNLFSDYRDSKFSMEMDAVNDIVVFFESIKHIVKGKKQSIVLDDPYSTAGSLLFETEVNKKIGFRVKVFSTEEAALDWAVS